MIIDSYEKILLVAALAGIAGWGLRAYYGRSRLASDELETLGRSIGTLFQLYSELTIIKANLDALATISYSPSKFEAVRQYTLRKFVRKDDDFKNDLYFASRVVAKYLPLSCHRLEKIISQYEYFQSSSFDYETRDRATYIIRLTNFGKKFERYQGVIATVIKRLALIHSLSTWVSVNLEFMKLSRSTTIKQTKKTKIYQHLEDVYRSISPESEEVDDSSSY